jgi:hypothetical protein
MLVCRKTNLSWWPGGCGETSTYSVCPVVELATNDR